MVNEEHDTRDPPYWHVDGFIGLLVDSKAATLGSTLEVAAPTKQARGKQN